MIRACHVTVTVTHAESPVSFLAGVAWVLCPSHKSQCAPCVLGHQNRRDALSYPVRILIAEPLGELTALALAQNIQCPGRCQCRCSLAALVLLAHARLAAGTPRRPARDTFRGRYARTGKTSSVGETQRQDCGERVESGCTRSWAGCRRRGSRPGDAVE